MNIAELLSDDDEADNEAPRGAGIWPYPLNVGGPQLLPGRTRSCCFWVSAFVPYGMRYVIDTTQLAKGQRWQHNPAQDAIPDDALLVVIHPKDAEQIRKAMASHATPQHPAFIAARIIDGQCKEDSTLADRLKWRVRS